MKTPALAALLLVVPFATAAQNVIDTPMSSSTVASTTPNPGEEMVCVREKKLGTNFVERVCMTVKQRDELRERARMDMQATSKQKG